MIADEVEGETGAAAAERVAELDAVERKRRHLWTTVLAALGLLSIVVIVMSYWTDVVPDDIGRIDFKWLRFAFLSLTVGFLVYSILRERMLVRIERHLIDERKRAAELTSRVADIKQMNELRADIVATVTHELKTPLTSLLGYATILRRRDGTLTPEQREEFFSVMEKQGQRIMKLIEDLLTSSRAESGASPLRRVELDIPGIVRSISNEVATGRGRAIEVEAPDGDLGVFGDPGALEHIITNLLDNAIKYSPDDSVVRVGVLEGDGELLVSVTDEGEGIDAEDLPFVFERFQQATNARGRASVGLGLYIVRNLITAHGGRVWVDSEVGKGTTFTVALPRRRH